MRRESFDYGGSEGSDAPGDHDVLMSQQVFSKTHTSLFSGDLPSKLFRHRTHIPLQILPFFGGIAAMTLPQLIDAIGLDNLHAHLIASLKPQNSSSYMLIDGIYQAADTKSKMFTIPCRDMVEHRVQSAVAADSRDALPLTVDIHLKCAHF